MKAISHPPTSSAVCDTNKNYERLANAGLFCWKGKDMFKNKILKKIGAGLMAGLCAFTLIGTNIGGLKTSAATTAKEPLLSGDEVIKQAAKYLGVPYGWDCKGYDGVYSSSSPKKQ